MSLCDGLGSLDPEAASGLEKFLPPLFETVCPSVLCPSAHTFSWVPGVAHFGA